MEPQVYHTFAEIEDRHWWFVARRDYIERLINRFIQRDADNIFCEVGCGTGGNLPLLCAHAQVDAIEMEDFAREHATQRAVKGVRRVESGSLPNDLPVTGPYQAVFALDVVEHLALDVESVKALGKLLDGKGALILTVPAYQWMWSKHDVINQHVRRYSKSQIEQVVEAAGLTVVYSSYFNTLLAPIAILVRMLEKVMGDSTKEGASVGMTLPGRWVNGVLRTVFGLEKYFAGRLKIPFGLSIAVVAKPSK